MKDGLEYVGRARLQALTLLVLAFLTGALAGATADRLLPGLLVPRPLEQAQTRRLPRVLEEMNLTLAQRAEIDSIIDSGRPRNEAIMNEVLPRLRAVGDSLHQGVRSVLTPAQASRFDAYLKSHRGSGLAPPPLESDGGPPPGEAPPAPRRGGSPPPRTGDHR